MVSKPGHDLRRLRRGSRVSSCWGLAPGGLEVNGCFRGARVGDRRINLAGELQQNMQNFFVAAGERADGKRKLTDEEKAARSEAREAVKAAKSAWRRRGTGGRPRPTSCQPGA